MSRHAYMHLENGNRAIKAEVLPDICKILDLKVSALYGENPDINSTMLTRALLMIEEATGIQKV